MATRRYGISPGENEEQVTEAVGAAVATDVVELTVDLAGPTMATAAGRERVITALRYIEHWIRKGNWPPA